MFVNGLRKLQNVLFLIYFKKCLFNDIFVLIFPWICLILGALQVSIFKNRQIFSMCICLSTLQNIGVLKHSQHFLSSNPVVLVSVCSSLLSVMTNGTVSCLFYFVLFFFPVEYQLQRTVLRKKCFIMQSFTHIAPMA